MAVVVVAAKAAAPTAVLTAAAAREAWTAWVGMAAALMAEVVQAAAFAVKAEPGEVAGAGYLARANAEEGATATASRVEESPVAVVPEVLVALSAEVDWAATRVAAKSAATVPDRGRRSLMMPIGCSPRLRQRPTRQPPPHPRSGEGREARSRRRQPSPSSPRRRRG